MKVLVVGSNSNYAIERFYIKYLERSGIEIIFYPAQDVFLDYYKSSLLNKIFFRLGFEGIYARINVAVCELISKKQPQIMFVFKGMELRPETLAFAKKNGIKLVNYNPDNPFIFSGRGSGNSNITNSIALYDLHFTYNLEVKKMIEEKFKIQTEWVPFGFELPNDFNAFDISSEKNKVCFVGTPDNERIDLIEKLADTGVEIDVYGNKWKKKINHKNVTVCNPVYDTELLVTLRNYRIQLNPLRRHNKNSHAMRSFEVPSVGGIMLAPRTIEHECFFKDGEEAFFYENFDELVSSITLLLGFSKEEALKIRKAAAQRCTTSNYSYEARSKQVEETFRKLLNE